MRRMGSRWVKALMATVLVLSLTGVTWAQNVIVKLKDGRTVPGKLVKQSDKKVTVNSNGVELTFTMDKVASVTPVEAKPVKPKPAVEAPKDDSLAADFATKRKAIDDADFGKRYRLANDFFQIGEKEGKTPKALSAYKLSLGEMDSLVKAKPDSLPYKFLRNELAKRVAALDKSGDPTKPDGGGADSSGGTLISADQQNLLWVYETDPKDRKQQSAIRKMNTKAVKKLFEDPMFRADPEMKPFLGRTGTSKFGRLQGHQQLSILFSMRARDYYSEIKVGEPPHMKLFSTEIFPRYVKHCASCHSGKTAKSSPEALKGLTLVTKRTHTAASVKTLAYTNYMIMVETSSGPFQIIDRGAPGRSPLLDFGLPTASAVRPHPKARGFTPFFTKGAADKKYTVMLNWIGKLYPNKYPFSLSKPSAAKPPAAP